MSVRCNKCHQTEPHLGDSWCIACTGCEALVGELRAAWGLAGTRALAHEAIVSTVRQVRALRRLGIAGAGRVRASSPPAGPGRAECAHPPPERGASSAKAPVPAVAAEPEVKKEEEEGSSDYSGSEQETDGDGVDEEANDKKETLDKGAEDKKEKRLPEEEDKNLGLVAVPKSVPPSREARLDTREDLPRRRASDREPRDREAENTRASSRDRRREPRSRRAGERSGRDRARSRSRHHRRHSDRGEHQEGRRKRRKTHRAGAKHPRLYRAANEPFRRYHQKPPDSFWDHPAAL